MVKKLVEKGLLRRLDSSSNDRTTLLFPTEAGLELHNAHKQFDTAAAFGRSYKALCEVFTPEEVNNAWHILETWLRIRRQMGWH
jgi:DNA-binding MarR family transcriptional regulator